MINHLGKHRQARKRLHCVTQGLSECLPLRLHEIATAESTPKVEDGNSNPKIGFHSPEKFHHCGNVGPMRIRSVLPGIAVAMYCPKGEGSRRDDPSHRACRLAAGYVKAK